MKQSYRGRMFWKIFIGFWIVFVIMSQLIWLGFTLSGKRHEPPELVAIRRIVDLQMTSAASVLERGGPDALNAMLSDWDNSDRQFFHVTQQKKPSQSENSGNMDIRGRFPEEVVRWVHGADGKAYQLRYDLDGMRKDSTLNMMPRKFLNIPEPMFVFAGSVGLLFSLLLAWNLTRPMRQLREGFSRVAEGDLSVRLFPIMRKRHDEISNVAEAFDAMVERLDTLVRAREELLHDISHELRSPLARLQLATGLARQTPESVNSSLDRIDEEARRLDKMIGELLTLSRAEHESIPDEQYFDLTGLLQAVITDVRYEAQIPGVQVELQVDERADYTVRGNAELIRRGAENVLRNALRFSLPGQRIDVHLHAEQQWLVIQVRDQGPGVDEEKLSSIFDPFVRVNSPLMGKGYGLGLAIVRKVVLAHHGEVEARNRPEGGLELTLRLPHWQP
ncbi:ATP-binding protein [Pantoea agglomerans]|uniref:ATP-binding protein n=1 Tax=Enterobacter agglomerans TaxID=549 RepID=UPI0013BD24D2|nr:ATP-binding protein [Pantoea agglomerans]NEG58064.1 HAMP domain-containing protein [Pantoea agglomerans]NEG99777.1 HAMP domain-containing protein [Pantoea agglomerans]NEH04260.1 HAMP domain-containing protein [Pantoea agglomerans]NEH14337.1 HAMP domain-containing protein [Pantoea agglomerans]